MSIILPNKKDNRLAPGTSAGLPATTSAALFAACLLLLCAGLSPPGIASAADTDRYPKRVAVFVSREIKPYLQAVETLTQRLSEAGRYRTRQVVFSTSGNNDPEAFLEQIEKRDYDLVVAVGPEASRLMADNRMESVVPIVYTMLLDPESIFSSDDPVSGVSLNVPIESQLQEIRRTVPRIRTVGVLFDPENNGQFFDDAVTTAETMGLEVAAIAVKDKTEIPGALGGNWHKIEALWLIPDRTVISESIVQYIIKEALLRNVPVIGYNRFFYDYGAALALILDYGKIGVQTAEIVIDRLENGISRKAPPTYDTVVNERVLKQMGLVSGEVPFTETGWP